LAVADAILVTWARVFSMVADASMPMTRRPGRPSSANPAIMPACVEPVTVHTITWSKKMSCSASCCATSRAQLAKPRPPSGWSDAPAGIGYGFPPDSTTESIARCQLSRSPMSNPAGSSRTSAPMMRDSWMFPTLS
jgi:hypothetical protein